MRNGPGYKKSHMIAAGPGTQEEPARGTFRGEALTSSLSRLGSYMPGSTPVCAGMVLSLGIIVPVPDEPGNPVIDIR